MNNTLRRSAGVKLIIFPIFIFFSGWPAAYSQDTIVAKSEYIPDIDVILKVKSEFDLDNSLMRFEVRNARFGLKGKINDFMSYKIELDLSDEGKMKMLDAYVKFTPLKNLDIYLGQRKIPSVLTICAILLRTFCKQIVSGKIYKRRHA